MTDFPEPNEKPWDEKLQAYIDEHDQAIIDELASLPVGGDMLKSDNLAGLASIQEAQQNIGLGDAASKDVGTDPGTVAAGDDGRITGSLQQAANGADIPDPAAFRTAIDVLSAEETADAIAAGAGGGSVDTVNGHTGPDITLTASDVGAEATGVAAGLVGTEAGTRAAADTTNAAAIAAEATTRATADTTNASATTAEASSRAAADTTLQTNITSEATARAAADTTNANAISAETTRATTAEGTNSTAISAETTRATAAEGTNATAITTEATARAAADSSEATTRATADTTLQTNITSEASTRSSADTTLQSNITAEASTRATADTTNATAISSEATTRATADTTNATAITTEASRATAAETALVANATGLLVNSRKTWIRTQNAYQLRHFLGLIPQAKTVPIKIFVDGDSIEEGTGTAGISERWINQFKDQISAAVGCDAGSPGYIPALYSGVVGNPAWQTTLVSGDAGTLNQNGIGKRSWLSASGSTNQRTFTSVPCDRLAVLYNKGSARGKIEVRIDNVLVASFDTWQAGAGPTAAIWDSVTDGSITITPGIHTIKLTTINTGTGATYACDIAGIFPYWQNHDAGVQLWEGAHAGFPSQTFSAVEQAHITLIDPDLVLHCKGANDSAFSQSAVTLASHTTSNITTVNGLVAGDCSHAVFASWGNSGSQTALQWAPYHDALFNAAIGVAGFAEQGEWLGWPATDAATISDGVAHPDVKGGEITATIVADALCVPPIGRNRNGARMRLPAGGSFGWYEVSNVAGAGVRNNGEPADRVYFTGLGGVGFTDGTAGGVSGQALFNGTTGILGLGAMPLQGDFLKPTPVTKTANWTWALTEGGKDILANPSGDVTGTIPPNATVPFPVGTTVRAFNTSTHTITIAAGAGVTINAPATLNLFLTQQHDMIELEQVAPDVWQVINSTDMVTLALLFATDFAPVLNPGLTVQTANFNFVASRLAQLDPSAGPFTGTLPTAPPNGTVVAAKIVTQSGTSPVTIACGGSDVFDKTGGVTSKTLSLLGESIYVQYRAAISAWIVLYHMAPVAQLDLRYGPLGGWISDTATWKYSGAAQITIPGDVTSYLGVGTKVSLNDGAVKYAQISGVSASAVSVTGIASTIGTSLFTKTAHGLGQFVPVTISGLVTTTGVTNGAVYWPVNVTANTFQLANTPGGTAITLGGTADAAIAVSTATVVNVATQSDATFTNATFTAPRFSYAAQPVGYPGDGTWARTGPNEVTGPGAVRGTPGFGIFGDGSDGVVNFDGTNTRLGMAPSSSVYTLTRDIYLADGSQVSGSAQINTAGFKIFCSGTFTIGASAVVNRPAINGSNGGAGGSTTTGGSTTLSGGGGGGNGAAGTVGTAAAVAGANLGSAGGAGGAATGGGTGGGVAATACTNSAVNGTVRNLGQALSVTLMGASTRFAGGNGGSGGSAGAGTGVGGGGGAGGMVVALYCYRLVNNGAIQAKGGTGGNGVIGSSTGAGGGGGGGGGAIIIVCGAGSTTGTLTVTGGAGGVLAGAGATGAAGATGVTYVLNL